MELDTLIHASIKLLVHHKLLFRKCLNIFDADMELKYEFVFILSYHLGIKLTVI